MAAPQGCAKGWPEAADGVSFPKNEDGFMKRIALGAAAGLVVILFLAAGFYLRTPAPADFDADAARAAAARYDARAIRDGFGVPHIYGARDADVAFGLAYAHAEDDWATFEEVLAFSRGRLGLKTGKNGAVIDYLTEALGVREAVAAKYDSDLSGETKALLEGYAAGLNLWCAEKQGRCSPGAAPVTPQDIVAGFVARTPFFYGLEETLTDLFENGASTETMIGTAREAFLRLRPEAEFGSNAMAVAPSRSADGHTRLMANSHQPFTGPVAWYEARVKSEEGWDMIGGLFPGAPLVLLGAGPRLGWSFTVNKPDLVDIFTLEVDDPKKPVRYRFDGDWREFEVKTITLRVKLIGPFSLPVKRRVLRSVHGPAFVTKTGVYAVSYAGAGDVRAVEQWYRMNRAASFGEWRAAMAMLAIPSFNAVYADGEGRIAYFHNMASPVRSNTVDWSQPQPGDDPNLLWKGVRSFETVPKVVDPASGYVLSSNNTPFLTSGPDDNPNPADFPPHYGVDERVTNRILRAQALYGGDGVITEEEFIAYKMDDRYAANSRLMTLIRALDPLIKEADEPALDDARVLLKNWNGSTASYNHAAALAILTGQKALGYLLNGRDASDPDPLTALRKTVDELEKGFGRINPAWGEVSRLKRGDVDTSVDGGPDTLRAIYDEGDPAKGALTATAGDSYILYADWDDNGAVEIRTIHQFGAATLDEASPHYADQAQLFAAEEWKSPPMELDALLAEATVDYRPGRN
ncbi:MAG: penicillin acylase family protein [Parvularculaceae bacterium]